LSLLTYQVGRQQSQQCVKSKVVMIEEK